MGDPGTGAVIVDLPSERPATLLAADAWGLLRDVVDPLDDAELLLPTRCAGWRIADLLFHLVVDGQMLLVTLASPAEGPATADFISYWVHEAPGRPSFDHAQFVRRGALAYGRPTGLKRHWADISLGALRAIGRADEQTLVETPQGHVMATRDVAVVSVVELTVHCLDMTAALDDVAQPAEGALRLVRVTLDGLLGEAVNADWDDVTYALKGSGRVSLTDAERTQLGPQAAAFPLLG